DDDDEDTLVITYPEKNWKLLLGSFFGISASWGLFFICGTFQDYYSKNQLKQYTSFQISWIFSLYYFLIVSGNLLTGLYFDFYGFQKFLCLLLIPGFLLLPFVQTFWEIISVFALLGLGGGIIIPPILGCISDYFYEKRNFANSLAITGGNIVGIVFPIILQKGFTSIGYKNTSFIVCGMFLIQLGICLLLCRDRKELRRKLQPDETFLKLYFQESFDYTSLFTSLRFILVTIGITTAEVSTGVLLIYITSYCSNILHFSDSESFNIVTILNAGTLFGGCFFGMFLANKIGTINSVMIACFNLLVLNFVVWLWLTQKVPKLMYLYSLLLGFNCGGMMSLCPSICGIVSNYYDFGKKYSTIYFVVGVGFLAGIPVSGIIIGNSNKANFVYFIVYCSTLIFLSLLCFAILKFTYLKRN
ncbi:MFS general substrate transporter, partial [Hanseniaspora valbyensis NRRL Y-1626]